MKQRITYSQDNTGQRYTFNNIYISILLLMSLFWLFWHMFVSSVSFPLKLIWVFLPLYVLYCMWYIGYHNSSCCDLWLPDNTFMYSHEYTVAVCHGTVPLRLDSCCFLALRYVHNGPHWIKDQWHIESFLDDCKNSEGILLFTFSWSNSACMTLTCMTLTRAKPFACLTNLYVYMYDNIDPTYICFLINISYVSSQFVP